MLLFVGSNMWGGGLHWCNSIFTSAGFRDWSYGPALWVASADGRSIDGSWFHLYVLQLKFLVKYRWLGLGTGIGTYRRSSHSSVASTALELPLGRAITDCGNHDQSFLKIRLIRTGKRRCATSSNRSISHTHSLGLYSRFPASIPRKAENNRYR